MAIKLNLKAVGVRKGFPGRGKNVAKALCGEGLEPAVRWGWRQLETDRGMWQRLAHRFKVYVSVLRIVEACAQV